MNSENNNLLPNRSRRQFVMGASAAIAGSALYLSSKVQARAAYTLAVPELSGREINLEIGYQKVNFTGSNRIATTVNGTLPAPTLRLKEGQRVTIHVTNRMQQDTSVHWHGILLPSEMDGVPGMSFAGIKPGETFTYEFDVVQSGTYWYHSHSGYQEQTGLYGALIVEPREASPVAYDAEQVVLLSDWTDESPESVYAKLKKMSHYYNFNERTLGDWWSDVRQKGLSQTWRDRRMWNRMRMSDTDIADVTGSTYTYLMNGKTPDAGWTGLIEPGKKTRLRIINASAMSIFDVRIPGLQMTVVASDGQYVQPVPVDEFRIGVAETYDVIVEPKAGQAYTIFAQSIDRTGYARGTLTPDPKVQAVIPAMDPPPVLSHADMGHGAGHGDHSDHVPAVTDHSGHGDMNHEDHQAMGHGAMSHDQIRSMDHREPHHGANGSMTHGDHAAMSAGKTVSKDPTQSRHESIKENRDDQHGDHGHHAAHQQQSSEQVGIANRYEKDSGFDAHAGHSGGQAMHPASIITENLGPAGYGSTAPIVHVETEFGPHVDMRVDAPVDGISDPGLGLREHQQRYGRRVLTYADLRSFYPTADRRQPERELQIHLTGNMGRYMWSMNGVTHADAAPIELRYGERVRILLVNDTMMTHPIHLHGMWSELETGDPSHLPRKHTVLVQPGSKVSYLMTADAKGRWAYHCHLMFHMLGMMREVRVS